MKVLVEFVSDVDKIVLHFDKEVGKFMADDIYAVRMRSNPSIPNYAKRMIAESFGVRWMELDVYELSITKFVFFEWDDILPKILDVLREDILMGEEIELSYRYFSRPVEVHSIGNDAMSDIKKLISETVNSCLEFANNQVDACGGSPYDRLVCEDGCGEL